MKLSGWKARHTYYLFGTIFLVLAAFMFFGTDPPINIVLSLFFFLLALGEFRDGWKDAP